MSANIKLDIFRVLKAANNKDAAFFSSLTETEKKAFLPVIVSRWMTGTTNMRQLIFINEFVNPYTFSLYKHPELLWKLLVVASSGTNQKYTWIKAPGKSHGSRPTATKLVMEYYNYSSRDAIDALDILTREDLLELAVELGWQPDEVAKIKKEVKASTTAAHIQLDDASDLPLFEL